jgi:hypothetical protein
MRAYKNTYEMMMMNPAGFGTTTNLQENSYGYVEPNESVESEDLPEFEIELDRRNWDTRPQWNFFG